MCSSASPRGHEGFLIEKVSISVHCLAVWPADDFQVIAFTFVTYTLSFFFFFVITSRRKTNAIDNSKHEWTLFSVPRGLKKRSHIHCEVLSYFDILFFTLSSRLNYPLIPPSADPPPPTSPPLSSSTGTVSCHVSFTTAVTQNGRGTEQISQKWTIVTSYGR